MVETATIARPYGQAVFELADKTGTLEHWSAVLAALSAVSAHPDMRELLANPKVSGLRLVDVFLAAAEEGDSAEVRNFLQILAENRRLAALPQVREQFEALKNEREGTLDAQIASAYPLDDAQLGDLVADLQRRFKRKIRTQVSVDRELIGGVRVVIGDEVIDGSVRGKLGAMGAALKD
jgi:F-type H+-transporting ATPase subunit delta